MSDERRWFPLGGPTAEQITNTARESLRDLITNPRLPIRSKITPLPDLPRPVLRAPGPAQEICPTRHEFTCECEDDR